MLSDDGVTMVEATIGIALLLVCTLLSLQLVLLLHASIAAQEAAGKAARRFTITGGEESLVNAVLDQERATALGALRWGLPYCYWEPYPNVPPDNVPPDLRTAGHCNLEITVPVIVPGGTLLGEYGLRGELSVRGDARYPYGENSGL